MPSGVAAVFLLALLVTTMFDGYGKGDDASPAITVMANWNSQQHQSVLWVCMCGFCQMCQARGLLFLPASLIILEIEHTRRWNRERERTRRRVGVRLCDWSFFMSLCWCFFSYRSSHRRQQRERVSVYSSRTSRAIKWRSWHQIRDKQRSLISEAEFDLPLVQRDAEEYRNRNSLASSSMRINHCQHMMRQHRERETDASEGCAIDERDRCVYLFAFRMRFSTEDRNQSVKRTSDDDFFRFFHLCWASVVVDAFHFLFSRL